MHREKCAWVQGDYYKFSSNAASLITRKGKYAACANLLLMTFMASYTFVSGVCVLVQCKLTWDRTLLELFSRSVWPTDVMASVICLYAAAAYL